MATRRSDASTSSRFSLRSIFVLIAVLAVLFALIGYGTRSSQRRRLSRAQVRHAEEAYRLAHAIASFKHYYMESPPRTPDEIRIHTFRATRSMISEAEAERISDLDAAECLVFWLRGDSFPFYSTDRPLHVFYDFEEGRLVDRDRDGFQEYVASDGNPYRYRDGSVSVHCDATDADISAAVED